MSDDMGLSAALRWWRSPPPPSSSSSLGASSSGARGRREAQQQERTVVAAYRARLARLADSLSDSCARLDAEPDNHALLLRVRAARPRLGAALDAYYAALGRRDPSAVSDQLAVMEHCDDRLAAVDHNLLAEVRRFTHAADVV